MTKWVSAQSMRLKWRGFASNLTDSSKWELRELSELYEEVKELLDDASDGHAFPEEVAEAKHSAEEFLHRYERFVVNLDDDEKKEVKEQVGMRVDTIRVLLETLEE